MKTIDELGISRPPWSMKTWQASDDYGTIVESANHNTVCDCSWSALGDEQGEVDARLIAAAPELLAFAAAYYERHKRNAVKVNPSNGDKYQDGLMVMCKQALVKAGMMDESEVWKEDGNESE